jgi:hypothetical protein
MTDNERELLLVVARILARMSFGPPSDEKALMLRLIEHVKDEKPTASEEKES